MNKRKTNILLVIALLLINFTSLLAQKCESNELVFQRITASNFVPYYIQYDGSPFLNKEWLSANVTLVSNEMFSDVRIKFDLYNNDIIYFNNKLNKQLLIDKNIIKEITAFDEDGEVQFTFVNRCGNDTTNQSACKLYFLLHNDSISLLSDHVKKVSVYNSFNSSYGKLGIYYEKVRYLYEVNSKLLHVPPTRRMLLKNFPTIKKELGAYVRKKHLSIRNESDLILIFSKINELM